MENGIVAKTERFDKDTLLALLNHDGVSVLDKKNLKTYSKKRFDGNKVQIQYNYGKDWRKLKMGRISPDPYIGLCVFPSDIRACLAEKYYWDVDIVNAQPVILAQIAKQLGMDCPSLTAYVSNRENILKEICETHKIDRKDAKEICIAVLFGGIRTQHPLLVSMSQELTILSSKVVEKHPEIYNNILKLKKANPLASSLAIYIQNEERKVLACIEEYFQSIGRYFGTLIYDGGLLEKLENETSLPKHYINDCEAYIRTKLGLEISLLVKPLEHTFNFKKDDMVAENIIIDDSYASEQFSKIVESRKVGNDIFIYNPETERWGCSKNDIDTAIIANKTKLQFKQNSPTGVKLFNYGGCVKHINAMKTLIPIYVVEGKLPIQYEYEFNEASEDVRIIELFNKLIDLIANGNVDNRTYLMKWIAHMIQKPYEIPKTCIIITGVEGSGKDTVFDLLGKFVIGEAYYANYNKTEQLFEKHDTSRANKLLVKVEEAKKKVFYENDDALKSYITSETQNFNPKNEKPFTVDNLNRFVATTNTGVPMKWDASSRRFALYNCSNEKCNNKPFWTEVRDTLFNMKAGATIGQYLKNYDISTFNPMILPQSDYKEMVLDMEEDLEKRFIRTVGDEWNDWLTMGELFIVYSNWCRDNGCSAIAATNSIALGKRFMVVCRDNVILSKASNKGRLYSRK
jgi:hypothetical protein